MPIYKITDNETGRTIRVSGEKPPTQADVDEIFSQSKPATQINPALKSVLNLVSPTMRIGDIAQGVSSAEATGVPSKIREFTAPQTEKVISKAKQGELPSLREAGAAGIEQASYLLPFEKINLGSKNILQRLATSGARGAAAGATLGTAEAVGDSQNLPEAVKDVGVASLLGLGTGTALQAGSEALAGSQKLFGKAGDFLKKKGYESYGKTFKENKTAQRIIDRSGGPEKIAKEFIDNKVPKTKSGVQIELRNMSGKYEKEVTNKLKTLGKTRRVDVDSLIDEAILEGQKIYKLPTPNEQRELKSYINYLESLRGQYSGAKGNLNNINELRKQLDKTYQGVDPSKIVDGEKLANDLLSDKLRASIQEKAPLTKSFFKKYSLLKKAEQIFYKEPKAGIVEITGAIAAPAKTFTGNLLELLAGKAVRSPGVMRGAASLVTGRSPRTTIPTPRVNQPTQTQPQILPAISAIQRAIENERNSRQSTKKLPNSSTSR